ncbi:uncharacterized protein GGS22DRAFT_154797 [Annulohypoxylon maeteangense]|uniref:uncharacterized protein n=1 Tax=Annulohypoxylon maeteangense TaxID=1927788 RepID=UPI0020088406|nr:uncharacterized protein GGS22DRAFT_154797 [Annulohypoxylon maeteangense]KAI0888007.1 hypothetical protein GGS22DRAFT_154797 [Annulohypoxylon maeteangense]
MQDYNQPNSRSCSHPKNPPQETVDTEDESLVLASQGELIQKFDSCDGEFDPIPLAHPSNMFTPINDGESSLFETTTDSSMHSDLVFAVDEQTHIRSSESSTSKRQTHGSKHGLMTHEETRDAKRSRRQLPLLATPSSSPFQTLRVTKARRVGNNVSLFKPAEETVIDHDDCHDLVTDSQFPQGWTVVDPLTPFPTRRQQGVKGRLNNKSVADSANNSDVMGNHRLTVSSSNIGGCTDFRDEYPLDDGLVEEDMTCLLDTALGNVQETHIPPSSVTQAWDRDSRSAVEYDPTLQHSSPFSSSERAKGSQPMSVTGGLHNGEEDLLDDDVDWNTVYAITNTIPKDLSDVGPQDAVRPSPPGKTTHMEKPIEKTLRINERMPMKPFVRPAFPEKIRDRSTVSGLSSDIVLRTCFRIGEMVNQAAHCLGHRQEAVFELYARVNYSNRESLQRRQHFQFIDLFKDQLPYPAGVLTNWRVGSQLDRLSSAFLNVSAEPKICRCVCKPIRDPKTAIGLSLVVLAIGESDWTQIEWAKQIVCGGDKTTENALEGGLMDG